MATLPPSTDYTGSTRTQGDKKAFMTSVRTFIADLLGTDSSDKEAARTALGVPVRAMRVDVASATTLGITASAPTSDDIRITGTATITAVNLAAGREVRAVFSGSLTLTNNANIVTQSAQNIVTQAGDSCVFRAIALNTVEVLFYVRAFSNQDAKSLIWVQNANGLGSTATAIRRFSSTVESQGGDITYADSAANGGSFTINVAGVYAISYVDQFNAAVNLGISANSNQLTTSIIGITIAHRLGVMSTAGANFNGTCHVTKYLAAGTVIRAHTAVGPTSGADPGLAHFMVQRVA
jgi:hypothetical protein